MLTIHHLSDSRSQRIVWLLEELGLPYKIVLHQRDPETQSGPPAVKALHPLGKSPVLDDDGQRIVESGAIVEYILTRYGGGRLAPDPAGPDLMRYLEFLYLGVSSGMNPILIKVYARYHGLAGSDLERSVDGELDQLLRYIDDRLGNGPWLLGDLFTAADIQLSFVAELARSMGSITAYPAVMAWLDRLHSRPGFHRAIARGGPYIYAKPVILAQPET